MKSYWYSASGHTFDDKQKMVSLYYQSFGCGYFQDPNGGHISITEIYSESIPNQIQITGNIKLAALGFYLEYLKCKKKKEYNSICEFEIIESPNYTLKWISENSPSKEWEEFVKCFENASNLKPFL